MRTRLEQALAEALGASVLKRSAVPGGDINEACRVRLDDGRRLFVKSHARAPAGMFAAEARGLAWLAETPTPTGLKVPQVFASREADADAPAFLAMEHVEAGPKPPGFGERFGRALAALHRSGAPAFGFLPNNFIGTLPQDNAPASSSTWAAFYRERRLEPQIRRAVDAGFIELTVASALSSILADLEDLAGPEEAPARLHGDLWGGNHMASATGEPVVFDPAAYGGHREIDLAMMRLFGGYDAEVFAAYAEVFPLSPGHERRVPLWQLYPLLVHVNLFDGAYVGQLRSAIRSAREG